MEPKPPGAPQAQQCSAAHKAWAGRVALQALGSADFVSGGSVACEMYVTRRSFPLFFLL